MGLVAFVKGRVGRQLASERPRRLAYPLHQYRAYESGAGREP